jgi:SAM-dependent methyltransferase
MHSAQFALHANIEDRHWWFAARRRIVRRIIDHVLSPAEQARATGDAGEIKNYLSPGDKARRPLVIDVGCGTGGNIASLSDSYRCVGIDTSDDAIQWARQRFPNIQFIEGKAPDDLGDLVREASLITMMDVLEHVSDDFQLLSSMLAPLTPGTYVLLTVPAELALWSPHDESFGHYRRYDSARLQAVWEGLPVETLLFSHYNARLYRVIKTIRTMTRWLRHSAGEHGTDFSMPPAPLNWLLEQYFAGESGPLCEALEKTDEGYDRGVSLIALLRRKTGHIQVRCKPREYSRDHFQPPDPAAMAARLRDATAGKSTSRVIPPPLPAHGA